jgi:hypothetical protein
VARITHTPFQLEKKGGTTMGVLVFGSLTVAIKFSLLITVTGVL